MSLWRRAAGAELDALPSYVGRPAPGMAHRARLPLGVCAGGGPVDWNLQRSPHLLVSGPAGSGVTTAHRGLIMEAAWRGWSVWVCDQTRQLAGFRRWPNVALVATTPEQWVAVVLHARAEMDRRYVQLEHNTVAAEEAPPLLVLIEDYRCLDARVTAWWGEHRMAGMPTEGPVNAALQALVQRGGPVRVHVVLSAPASPRQLLRNHGAGGPVLAETTAALQLESRRAAGRSSLVHQRGDVDGDHAQVQLYWTPDPLMSTARQHDRDILGRLRPPQQPHHPRLQVVLAEQLLHEPAGVTSTWPAVRHSSLVPALDLADPEFES